MGVDRQICGFCQELKSLHFCYLLLDNTKYFFFFSGEIDRCLKKVSEGVEVFEDIWKKVYTHIMSWTLFAYFLCESFHSTCTKYDRTSLYSVCIKHRIVVYSNLSVYQFTNCSVCLETQSIIISYVLLNILW